MTVRSDGTLSHTAGYQSDSHPKIRLTPPDFFPEEVTMSNPPPWGWPRPILDSGSPRRTMVLRHPKSAYISLTARRAQPAGPPPTRQHLTAPQRKQEIHDASLYRQTSLHIS